VVVGKWEIGRDICTLFGVCSSVSGVVGMGFWVLVFFGVVVLYVCTLEGCWFVN